MKRRLKVCKPLTRREVLSLFGEQFRPPFRGEIWDFFRGVPMGRGFANKGEDFKIETAYYLRPILSDIRRRPYGKWVLRAAVQGLKTLVVEMSAGYHLVNYPGDMCLYFPGDESAYDQATSRSFHYLRKQPQIAEILRGVMESGPNGRFNLKTDTMLLPAMTLRAWPLNQSSTQRLSLRYVFISDAFLSERTGLIQEAIARTTAHDDASLKDYKIIIESQGGEPKDDMDEEWESTNQQYLHVRCPYCDSLQPFEWRHERPADFVPVPPKDIPSLDRANWISHWLPILTSKERKYAGMQRGEDVKRGDDYDDEKILRQTYYECLYCGSAWRDTPDIRLKIDASSTYVPARTTAPSHFIGYSWPFWAGQRNEWGKVMVEYLAAKKAASMGNYTPIKQWHQKRAARNWTLELERPEILTPIGSYDPNQLMPDELCRIMSVDCQQNLEHKERTGQIILDWFWIVVRVIDKHGNSRQLERGHFKGWEARRAVQDKWKIPNDYVVVDIGNSPDQIIMQAAQERETITMPYAVEWMRTQDKTWLLLNGSDERSFGKHKDGKYRSWAPMQTVTAPVINSDGRRVMVLLKKIRWSNVAFKMQLDAIRSGAPGMPRFEALSRDHLSPEMQEMERGNLTYEKQMDAEFYDPKRGKDAYTPAAESRPCHYRDCELQILVKMATLHLIGHQAAEAVTVQ